jgi:membrane-associated phospholipid phosphatase
LHWAEALLLTDAISEAIRGPVGRARPRVSQDDAFKFQFWRGFTNFDNRAFPSLHSAVGFATAAALLEEIRVRNPGATWYAAPFLYGFAVIPGLTRVYLNQHWASDVVAGAFVGQFLGYRVVHYAHTHKRNKLDRALLATSIAPNGFGGTIVSLDVQQLFRANER